MPERIAILDRAQLGTLALRDVDGDAHQLLAIVLLGSTPCRDPAHVAIGGDHAVLDVDLLAGCERLLDRALELVAIRRVRAFEDVLESDRPVAAGVDANAGVVRTLLRATSQIHVESLAARAARFIRRWRFLQGCRDAAFRSTFKEKRRNQPGLKQPGSQCRR